MAALFIPTKIRVGYQERGDTFTGKLAYVIYFDDKGKLRKEKSWSSWCNSVLGSADLDNKPTNFTLNKGVQRYSGWNGSGRNMVRVYDHRDFEFEITVDNLLGILHHSIVDHSDVKQECVYAWNGTELVLLPTNSVEYIESVKYTAGLSNKITAKELVIGATYVSKSRNGDKCVYLGKHEWASVTWGNWCVNSANKTIEKGGYRDNSVSAQRSTIQPGKHVYWNIDSQRFETLLPSKMSTCTDASVHPELSVLLHKYDTFLDSLKHKPITHESLFRECHERRPHQNRNGIGFLSAIGTTENVAIGFNFINSEYDYQLHKYVGRFRHGQMCSLIPTLLKSQHSYSESALTYPFLVYAPDGIDTTIGTYVNVADIALSIRTTVQPGDPGDTIVVINDKLWNNTWYAHAHSSWLGYGNKSSEYHILTDGKKTISEIHEIIVSNVKTSYGLNLTPWVTPNGRQIHNFINELVDNFVFVAVVNTNQEYAQFRFTFVDIDILLTLLAKHFPSYEVNTSNLFPSGSTV